MASYTGGKETVVRYLKSHFPKGSTCLDVGCSDGRYYFLLSDHFIVDGVEIFEPYIKDNKLYDLYRNLTCANIVDFKYTENYDVVVFGDILEHLSVENAQKVVAEAKLHSKEIVFAVPYLLSQGGNNGNDYEAHIQDDLTPEIVKERYPGFDLILQWEDRYAYYKLESNPRSIDTEFNYAKAQIEEITKKQFLYSRDYLELERACLWILDIYTEQLKDHAEIDSYLWPYMNILKDGILNHKFLGSYTFWKQYYHLNNRLNNPSVENKKEILNYLINTERFVSLKYAFDVENRFLRRSVAKDELQSLEINN